MGGYKLLLMLGLSLLFLKTVASVQRFEIEPQDQTVLVNSRVILPCRVSDKEGILQWTKDDFGLGIHRNLSGWDRYNMIGSDEKGDYYLEIYPVTLEDDGKYQCQVSPGSDYDQEIRSNFATLTVVVPPEPPRIIQGNYLTTYEYMEIKLECISYGGRPAASISWIDNYGNQLTHGIEYIVNVLPDGKRFLIKSILKMIPRKQDQNSTLTCRAQNSAEITHQSAKVKLEVKYRPYVTVWILSGAASNGLIPEGTDVQFECHVEANPSNVTYEWLLNNKMVVGNTTSRFVLRNVTRKYQDAKVTCKAHNRIGTSEDEKVLDISFGPRFRGKKPQSVLADNGEIVTLACDVVGNPLPDITWSLVNSSQVICHDRNLTLRANTKTAGWYLCKAHIEGFVDVEAQAAIFLKGLPVIKSPSTQFGIEGDTVNVECTAQSIPPPSQILWTFNATEIQGEDCSILEDTLPEGAKSTVVIRKSQKHHFGLYTCKVTNSYGSDVLEIILKTEENLTFMFIVNISITAVLLLTSIVIVIIFFLYRRYRRKPMDVDINIIENQLRESNGSLKAEEKTECTESNPSDNDVVSLSETETKCLSPKACQKPLLRNKTVASKTLPDHTYVAIDDYRLDYWPPVSNPNYIEVLPDPPIQLSTLESMNFFPPSGLSTFKPDDIPNVVAMDPKFNGNSESSDLKNLKLRLPIRKKPNPPPKSPTSPYVRVGCRSKRLPTIYE